MPTRKTRPRRIRKEPVDKVAIIPQGPRTSLALKGDARTTGMRQSARKRTAAKRLSADDGLSDGDFQKVLKAFVPDVENLIPMPENPEEENTPSKIQRKSKDSKPDEDIEFSTRPFQISNRKAAAAKKLGQKVVAEKQADAEVTGKNSEEEQSEDKKEETFEKPEEENTLPKIESIFSKLKDSQPDEDIKVCVDNFCTAPVQVSNRRAAAAEKCGQKVVAEKQADAEVTGTNSEDEEEETFQNDDWQKYIKPIETPRSSKIAKNKSEKPEEENTPPKIRRKSKDSQPDEDIEVCDDEHNVRSEEKQCENEEEQTIQSVEPNDFNPFEGKDTEAGTLPKTLPTIPHDQASKGIVVDSTIFLENKGDSETADVVVTQVQDDPVFGMDNEIFVEKSLLGYGGEGVCLKTARNQNNKGKMTTEEMYQRKQICNLKTSEIKQKIELRNKKMELFDLKIEKAKLKIESTKKRLQLEIEVLELKKKKYAAELD